MTWKVFRGALYAAVTVAAYSLALRVHHNTVHGSAARCFSVLVQSRQAKIEAKAQYEFIGPPALGGTLGGDPITTTAILIVGGMVACVWILRTNHTISTDKKQISRTSERN